MKSKNKTSNSFSYMTCNSYMTANFAALQELAEVTGASLLGGTVAGGSYAATKKLMGDKVNEEEFNKEVAANVSAGVSTGVGGYLLTKAMRRRNLGYIA